MVVRLKYILLFYMVLLLNYSCSITRLSKDQIFQIYSGKSVPDCFDNFEGMGRDVFPNFLSWGCFKYKTTFECLNNFYLEDTFVTENDSMFLSESGRIFTVSDCTDFPNDLSFYQKAIDEKFIDSTYDCLNKIHISGIRFPYLHYILFDTFTFEVIHLVTGVRE